MRICTAALASVIVACSSGVDGGGGLLLADLYPGDRGIDSDPAVVWAESFEEGAVGAVTARYDDFKYTDGWMTLEQDVPAGSSGRSSLRLAASGSGPNATDLYKSLGTGYDELYLRYYVKYEPGAPWHHSGFWLGGYNPPSSWPRPGAGTKPDGDDRFSVSLEPVEHGTDVRLDFYDYWMTMHSWMDQPSGDTAYYGNTLIHDTRVVARGGTWMCVEVHVKLNPDPASAAGAELGLWLDDVSQIQFTDSAPLGYWVKDKFCPEAADGPECTAYRPASPTLVPLDLRYRSDPALKLNALWPQNYITDPGSGSMWLDDVVVATRRIGCLR